MQTPVRYYITQSDDHPVVRSVPVSVRAAATVDDARPTPNSEPETGRTIDSAPRPTRVTRFVRAATRRAELPR
jgi:hypothetical protein